MHHKWDTLFHSRHKHYESSFLPFLWTDLTNLDFLQCKLKTQKSKNKLYVLSWFLQLASFEAPGWPFTEKLRLTRNRFFTYRNFWSKLCLLRQRIRLDTIRRLGKGSHNLLLVTQEHRKDGQWSQKLGVYHHYMIANKFWDWLQCNIKQEVTAGKGSVQVHNNQRPTLYKKCCAAVYPCPQML